MHKVILRVCIILVFFLSQCEAQQSNINVIKYNFRINRGRDIQYFVIIDTLNNNNNILSRTQYLTQKNYLVDSLTFRIDLELIQDSNYQEVEYYKLPVKKIDSCEVVIEEHNEIPFNYKVCFIKELENIKINNVKIEHCIVYEIHDLLVSSHSIGQIVCYDTKRKIIVKALPIEKDVKYITEIVSETVIK
ncbi:MAG: hypothetical protein NW226_14025 [Microscillaceae bacterium]|nr:hypothetical protein [Microscillaceae bacterium]